MRLLIILGIIFSALALAGFARAQTISDGDLVKTADSFDIYIVKIKAEKKFKRLILNPAIFNSYGHLKWENVKTVSSATLAEYRLSEFVIQVNPDGTVADPKVYKVSSAANSDAGERRWLNITAAEFQALNYDWDSIYFINSTEASPSFYPTKFPLSYMDLTALIVPLEKAPSTEPVTPKITADKSSPAISGILADKFLADSALVSWSTDESASSIVKYGTSESALDFSATGTAAQAAANTFSHSVKLSGLEASTKYYFQAISTDPSGNVSQISTNSFTTTDCYGDVPKVHSTIQMAIDAIIKSGGKICVAAGTFNENILIDGKDVKIVGKGAGKTTLNSTKTFAIKNVSAATEIEGMTIKSSTSSYAILIENALPIIKNNHIRDSFAGIRILGNSRPTIRYNIFVNNSGGATIAHNGNYGDYSIDHNTFVNNGKGGSMATILLDSVFPSSPVNITNNIFSGGFIGVYEVSPSNFYLWNNLFYNNSLAHLQRENSFYYSETPINALGVATKNKVSDPLLDSAYKLQVNSPAIGTGTDSTNIGAY